MGPVTIREPNLLGYDPVRLLVRGRHATGGTRAEGIHQHPTPARYALQQCFHAEKYSPDFLRRTPPSKSAGSVISSSHRTWRSFRSRQRLRSCTRELGLKTEFHLPMQSTWPSP